MPEVLLRMVTNEASRSPAANSWKLLYTADNPSTFGLDVCNGEATDAHISVCIIEGAVTWADGETPPPYSYVIKNQRVEADGTDGNNWVMPVKHLNDLDRVVVRTDVVGVTFYGHGFKFV